MPRRRPTLEYVKVANADAWPVAQQLLLDLEDVARPLAFVALLQAYVELHMVAFDYPEATRERQIAFVIQQGAASLHALIVQARWFTIADLDAMRRPPA